MNPVIATCGNRDLPSFLRLCGPAYALRMLLKAFEPLTVSGSNLKVAATAAPF